jgi:hypothetical protein
MLNISTNAWHYRLITWSFGGTPKGLCLYFWATVFSIVAIPGSLAGLLVTPLVRRIEEGWAWDSREGASSPSKSLPPLYSFSLAWIPACLIFGIVSFALVDGPLGPRIAYIVFFGLALCIPLSFTAVGLYKYYARPVFVPKPEKPEQPPRKPSKTISSLKLMWAFLVAKKRKACPRIEVVDA